MHGQTVRVELEHPGSPLSQLRRTHSLLAGQQPHLVLCDRHQLHTFGRHHHRHHERVPLFNEVRKNEFLPNQQYTAIFC